MASSKFSEKILIYRDPGFVFDYTQDYNKRLSWDTFLKKAELIDGAEKAGVGGKGLVCCSQWIVWKLNTSLLTGPKPQPSK
jgi:hypothetical protein